MTAHDDALFEPQETLYESRNPTRRWLHRTRRDWIVDTIARWGEGSGRALEIGPGSGVYLAPFADVAEDVVASDVEHAVSRSSRATTRHGNLRLVWDDITNSSFTDDEFDLVLCSEVIEHIADSSAALREMRRILSPNGTLILSTPQRYSFLELASKIAFLPGVIQVARRIYRQPVMETGHINLMTRRRLHDELRDARLEPVEEWLTGLYLPVVAEALGVRAVKIEKAWEQRLRGTRFEGVLWTQFVIARPVAADHSG